MEIGVQRTDSQRSQSNNNGNGPRVSFNKDVHVKRIGRPQPEQPQLSFRRELPENLSQEQILKEAEFVLAQAEKINCHADGGDLSIILNPKVVNNNDKQKQKLDRRKLESVKENNKFNSLPSRKKRAKSKPVERSVSDASSKKPAAKKSTIFNLFSRKSDTNLNEIDNKSRNSTDKNNNSNSKSSSSNKRVGRSKSDVGVTKESHDTIRQALQQRKRNNSESDDLSNLTLSNKRRTNSNQLSPIIEVSTPREEFFSDPPNLHSTKNDSKLASNVDLTINNPISDSVKDAIHTLSNTKLNSKSTEDMHSSQQPQLKPPLTKGLQVDGMVKRLSMERFSPPPHFSSPAFSYTRSPQPIITNDNQINHNPNGNIIYAQVVCDDNGKNKQTVHSTIYDAQRSRSPAYQNNSSSHQSSQKFSSNHQYNKSHDEIDGMNHMNGSYHNNPSSHHHQPHHYAPPQDSYKTKILISETRNPSAKIHNHHNYNNSDEDEGLGFEIKRGVEDESLISTREEEITPKIRDVPPEKPPHITQPISHHRGRADGMDAFFPEFQDLSERRKILESRIHSRRIGSREILDETSPERDFYKNPIIPIERLTSNERSNTRSPVPREYRSKSYDPYLDPNENNDKFHKLNKTEITTRYSPQRSHLDMVASMPKNTVTSSKVVRETKYYQDEHGEGVRETYNSETQIDKDGRPITKEYRIKEKTRPNQPREIIDLGYIEDHRDYTVKYNTNEVIDPNLNYFQSKYRAVHEPKSLDSQYSDQNRSSPEEQHHELLIHKQTINKVENSKYPTTKIIGSAAGVKPYPDYYQDSLKRHKKHQRSFDKGDSGIENDYRKDSFNGEFHSKWKKRTFIDDIKASDQFLRKERKHTDETAHVVPHKLSSTVIYHRERSIDDGSHYDPRLDKYNPNDTMRKSTSKLTTTTTRNHSQSTELLNGKAEKKISGLEKVKQLLTGTGKKKQTKKTETDKKDMVHEEDLRARYKEYRSSDLNEVKANDISTRRRLSTPKASPLPSQKSSSNESTAQKLGWFKSIDRLSRKKSLSNAPSSKVETISSTTSITQPIDETDDFATNMKIKPKSTSTPSKNLRFFGDTDIESNPSLSKAAWKPKSRHSIASSSNLSHTNNRKYSKSSYELDKIPATVPPPVTNYSQTLKHNKASKLKSERSKSASMQQLHVPSRRSGSRNNERYDYSGSDDETERDKHRKSYNHSPAPLQPRTHHELNESDNEDEVPFEQKRYLFEESYRKAAEDYHNRSKSRERSMSPSPANKTRDFKKPPPGPPPKPARVIDRRRGLSKEPMDRIQDSSGTEGDSSQLSQRSVVYLHATTVGEIPQPYMLNARRKAVSRDDLTSSSYRAAPNRKLTPMTKTVSRSVSVLAPWKPKHIRDGYEINYSQSNEKTAKKSYHNPSSRNENERKHLTSSQSTLSRPKKESSNSTSSNTLSRTSKLKTRSKDDLLSSERSVPKSSNGTLSRSHGRDKRMVETVEVHNHSNKENSSGRKWN